MRALLIGIKPDGAYLADTVFMPVTDVENPVTIQPKLRFAVAAFDTWDRVHPALRDLVGGGSPPQTFNFLGLERLLAGTTDPVAGDRDLRLQPLPFPGNPEMICCTGGPVAKRLAGRLGAGSRTLQAALSHWLIPRHAAHLQEAVESGRILLWVQIFDIENERLAYQCLLANTSNSVGVHDLIGA